MWYKKLIRNVVIASLAILALEWWAGVFTHQSEPPFKVWQDTIDAAEFDHLDYGALLQRCVKGDTDELRTLMQYSMKVCRSGAGSYGHGAAMLEVLWILGDAPFTSALSSLPPATQQEVLFMLGCGLEYTEVREHSRLPPNQFPRVRQAFLDHHLPLEDEPEPKGKAAL